MTAKPTLLIAAFISLAANGAAAQSVYSVLSTHDVLGTWSSDCTKPASGDTPRLILAAPPQGRGSLAYDRGPKGEGTTFVIRLARDLSADRLLLHQYQADDNSLSDLVLVKSQGKIRIVSEHETGSDKTLIRDGMVAATGKETPWLARCP